MEFGFLDSSDFVEAHLALFMPRSAEHCVLNFLMHQVIFESQNANLGTLLLSMIVQHPKDHETRRISFRVKDATKVRHFPYFDKKIVFSRLE
jgi:hypothetical protein